jgi:flagellar basal body rod protein FlgB
MTSDRYVGTFIGSMMTHLWIYNGTLDAAGKVLTLDTERLNFAENAMTKYQDIIEFVSPNHRMMTSKILAENGNWLEFMTAHYWRQK